MNVYFMKKNKILFWIPTVIIFLFESVMTAFTFQTDLAREGIGHLGYPAYFGPMLMVFKVLGGLALIIPQVPARVKEWSYAGFAIDFLSAFISIVVVDGFGVSAILPLVFVALLLMSYIYYHKINGGIFSRIKAAL